MWNLPRISNRLKDLAEEVEGEGGTVGGEEEGEEGGVVMVAGEDMGGGEAERGEEGHSPISMSVMVTGPALTQSKYNIAFFPFHASLVFL